MKNVCEKNKNGKQQKGLSEIKKSLEQQSIQQTHECRGYESWSFKNLAQKKVDWSIFKIDKLKYHQEKQIFQTTTAKEIYFVLCDLACQTQGNMIAIRREYLMAILEKTNRTISGGLKTLEDNRLISRIKGKRGFVYLALLDWTSLAEFAELDFLERSVKPKPFFNEISKILKQITQKYLRKIFRLSGDFAVGTKGKTFKLQTATIARMRNFNDALIEFICLEDSTIHTFSYAQITGKQLPSFECNYRRGIIAKNLKDSLAREDIHINKNFLVA